MTARSKISRYLFVKDKCLLLYLFFVLLVIIVADLITGVLPKEMHTKVVGFPLYSQLVLIAIGLVLSFLMFRYLSEIYYIFPRDIRHIWFGAFVSYHLCLTWLINLYLSLRQGHSLSLDPRVWDFRYGLICLGYSCMLFVCIKPTYEWLRPIFERWVLKVDFRPFHRKHRELTRRLKMHITVASLDWTKITDEERQSIIDLLNGCIKALSDADNEPDQRMKTKYDILKNDFCMVKQEIENLSSQKYAQVLQGVILFEKELALLQKVMNLRYQGGQDG